MLGFGMSLRKNMTGKISQLAPLGRCFAPIIRFGHEIPPSTPWVRQNIVVKCEESKYPCVRVTASMLISRIMAQWIFLLVFATC